MADVNIEKAPGVAELHQSTARETADNFMKDYHLSMNEQCKFSWKEVGKNAIIVPGTLAAGGCIASIGEGCIPGAAAGAMIGLVFDPIVAPLMALNTKLDCQKRITEETRAKVLDQPDAEVRAILKDKLFHK